jgi:hypothetical protein
MNGSRAATSHVHDRLRCGSTVHGNADLPDGSGFEATGNNAEASFAFRFSAGRETRRDAVGFLPERSRGA